MIDIEWIRKKEREQGIRENMRKGSLMNRHRVINNEEETKKGERDESEIERLSKNQWETINSKNERERERNG